VERVEVSRRQLVEPDVDNPVPSDPQEVGHAVSADVGELDFLRGNLGAAGDLADVAVLRGIPDRSVVDPGSCAALGGEQDPIGALGRYGSGSARHIGVILADRKPPRAGKRPVAGHEVT
jgi:hypothetical protein